MTKTPDAKEQLTNLWVGSIEDILKMPEGEVDEELLAHGIDPSTASARVQRAVERAQLRARSFQREQMRKRMELDREEPPDSRDSSISVEMAKDALISLIAANDSRMTLAARNRDPRELSDEEVLTLYWQIQELMR